MIASKQRDSLVHFVRKSRSQARCLVSTTRFNSCTTEICQWNTTIRCADDCTCSSAYGRRVLVDALRGRAVWLWCSWIIEQRHDACVCGSRSTLSRVTGVIVTGRPRLLSVIAIRSSSVVPSVSPDTRAIRRIVLRYHRAFPVHELIWRLHSVDAPWRVKNITNIAVTPWTTQILPLRPERQKHCR